MDAHRKFGEHKRSVRENFEAFLNWTHHFIEHGRVYIKILFMMVQ